VTQADAIISIRPEFAEAILNRSKSVELRRRIPATNRGTRLWIYATMPVGSIVGTAVVKEIARGSPTAIWNAYKAHVGLNRTSFFDYYDGADEAVALVLGTVTRCSPIGIGQLRLLRSGFHPPQVLTRLTSQEAEWLSSLGEVA